MKKYFWFLLLIVFLVCGCQSNKLKNEINDYVVNNSYSLIYNDLSGLINELKMFPTKESEEKFIYYISAIKENHEKFSILELSNISNLLEFEYNFDFNKLDYDNSDYQSDKDIINNYIK